MSRRLVLFQFCRSVTRFGEITPLWQNFNHLQVILGIVLYLANFFTYFGNIYATGQFFSDVNGQRLENKIAL